MRRQIGEINRMTWSKNHYKRKTQSWQDYDQNDGKPGVVYILRNEAFKENWLKIGQTTKSGHVRAAQINEKAGTGLPKYHVCVFEFKTVDCGRAEKEVHKALDPFRKGFQEFFEVDIEFAKETISEVCSRFNNAASQSTENHGRINPLERSASVPVAAQTSNISTQSSEYYQSSGYRQIFSPIQEPAQTKPVQIISPVSALVWNISFTICTLFVAVMLWNNFSVDKRAAVQPSDMSNGIVNNSPATPLSSEFASSVRKKNLEQSILETYKAYPYLATPRGEVALKKIIQDRNKRIESGVEPAQALRESVALIAPQYEPLEKK